jgi:hypothetical protein
MIAVKKQFLTSVGGIGVERPTVAPNGREIKRSRERVALSQEPNGVLHTTEGHWDPSLNVFTATGTPTFMVGYEKLKALGSNEPASNSTRIRVAQFMPIGEMALTLKNAGGGTETNRETVVQIELIGFSKFEKWSPPDPIMKVLADLVRQLNEACGIPLQRAGDGTRSLSRWDGGAGWFGHLEVPENDHTDVRGFEWEKLFRLVKGDGRVSDRWEIVSGGEVLFHTPARTSGGKTGVDRVAEWLKANKDRVREEEKKNGRLVVRRVTVPA